jgi:hypothetical protein
VYRDEPADRCYALGMSRTDAELPPGQGDSLLGDLGLVEGDVEAVTEGRFALDYVMASSAKMVCRSVVGWPCASAMMRRAGGALR